VAPASAAANFNDAARKPQGEVMSEVELETRPQSAGAGTLLAFTATTFLSALLLFSVQPMFAKMVLPLLGGSPSVWAVALCFFQGALLAGYCYAHLLMARVPAAITGYVHLALCAVALLFLPIALPQSWAEPPSGSPYFWQLALFATAIGVPFMAVAANAPLLQAWFARTGHAQGSDPYFLYAASNLGSLIALLGYPFVLEPVFGLKSLSSIWSVGFVALIAALAGCFYLVRRSSAPAQAPMAAADDAPAAPPTWTDRAQWVGLSLVPAALLTAFTTHIATDVASAPLIWVVPLALYLLTFVVVFRERAWIPMPVLMVLHIVAVIVALLQLAQTEHDKWMVTAVAGVAAFFASALMAHRTLYEARPAARHLTEFYLWMSLGGVLGGLFAALIAPALFPEVYEYPLLLALTMACRPGLIRRGNQDANLLELAIAATIAVFGTIALYHGSRLANAHDIDFGGYGSTAGMTLIAAVAMLALWRWPMRQAAAALVMCAMIVMLPSDVHRGQAQRSYFGVYRVMLSEDGKFNLLNHGTTLHGAQRIRDEQGNSVADTTPGTYYHPASPMAKSIGLIRDRLAERGEKGRYGIVGLGAGSLACYAKDGETWRFFEIDPVVVDIAKSPQFTYVANCLPKIDVVLGDARLTLAKEQDRSFDLIIVDAFSSDAVPVHLMTKEALELYRDKLRPGGVVVLHISNRYLDLDSILASTEPLVDGLDGILVSNDLSDGSYGQTTSTVAIFAHDQASLEPFKNLDNAFDFEPGRVRPWTDDASDILGPFISKMD
jgi:SAM-dependent methyltransferase